MDDQANRQTGLIKGLSYTFPTSGTIRLGHAGNGANGDLTRPLPVPDDEFALTTKTRSADGQWVRHPLDAVLREQHGTPCEDGDGESVRKLRAIPVSIVFDRPELNLTEHFTAFTEDGSPRCVGDGKRARRLQVDGSVGEEACAGPRYCSYGQEHKCDAFLRLLVRVDGQPATAPPFILRSGSVNAITDNRATLEHWAALYGGRLAGLPFTLLLEAKQSAASLQSVFHYARLEPHFATVEAGARLLQEQRQQDDELGIDRQTAEQALLRLRRNGAFAEDGEADGAQIEGGVAGPFGGCSRERPETEGDAPPTTGAAPRHLAALAVQELARRLSTTRPGADALGVSNANQLDGQAH